MAILTIGITCVSIWHGFCQGNVGDLSREPLLLHGKRCTASPMTAGGLVMSSFSRKAGKGFTVIELLITVAIIGTLSMIAVPNLLSAQRKTRYSQAASDTRSAVTQAMVYGTDRGVYPTSIRVIRDAGLTSLSDVDPWGVPYVLSPLLTAGQPPGCSDDVYIYSKGPSAAGTYPVPFVPNTGNSGSVGYSSVYGSCTGR